MDRIDIHVEVPAVAYKDLIGEANAESSERYQEPRYCGTRAPVPTI